MQDYSKDRTEGRVMETIASPRANPNVKQMIRNSYQQITSLKAITDLTDRREMPDTSRGRHKPRAVGNLSLSYNQAPSTIVHPALQMNGRSLDRIAQEKPVVSR